MLLSPVAQPGHTCLFPGCVLPPHVLKCTKVITQKYCWAVWIKWQHGSTTRGDVHYTKANQAIYDVSGSRTEQQSVRCPPLQ